MEAKRVACDKRSKGQLMYSGTPGRSNTLITSASRQKEVTEVPNSPVRDDQLLPPSVPIPPLSIKEELIVTPVIVHVSLHILRGF